MIHSETYSKITNDDSFSNHFTIDKLLSILKQEMNFKLNNPIKVWGEENINYFKKVINECENWELTLVTNDESDS